ncbi:F-box protein [Phanerochaete sordida]|uniref:F-box protein n=1 Tax=Phanerochaete sordida TaxID=48140 RepID=A0A9P3LB38_9APHY|nr:F-box protein [Phanerochaete sordida]
MTVDDLPAEILIQILVIYAADVFETFAANRFALMSITDDMYVSRLKVNFYDFAEVTRVCKRWRAIALDCPAFWSNVVVGPYGNTARMLARSKSHPLDVFCVLSNNQGGERRGDALELALEHLAQFRSFQLCVRRRDADEEPDSLYDAVEAPLLEDFTVHFAENLGDWAEKPRIRRVGCKWVAPRLWRYKVWGGHDQDLRLNSWQALQFKDTLTQLIWFPANASNTLFPSAETVISALRSLPHLETLQIAFSPKYPVAPFIPLAQRLKADPVHLPRLTCLVLEGHLDTCIDILGHVRHPEPLQQFGVISKSESKRTDSKHVRVADFFAEAIDLEHNAANPASTVIRTLLIQPESIRETGIELMGRRALCSPLRFPDTIHIHDQLSRPGHEDLDLCLSLPDVLPRSYLEQLFSRVRLDAVEALQLGVKVCGGYGHLYLADEWLGVAQKLAGVHTLVVGAAEVRPARLASALFLPPDAAGVRRCPYPALRRLHVTGFITPTAKKGAAPLSGTDKGALKNLLFECIYPLKRQGVCIDQFVFSMPEEELEKADLVLLKTVLDADVLCDEANGLRRQKSMLHRVPDTVEGEWQTGRREW